MLHLIRDWFSGKKLTEAALQDDLSTIIERANKTPTVKCLVFDYRYVAFTYLIDFAKADVRLVRRLMGAQDIDEAILCANLLRKALPNTVTYLDCGLCASSDGSQQHLFAPEERNDWIK
jgi:hypothetical protein